MTREEHIAALEKYRDGILSGGISVPYDDLMIALDASITALRGPVPDPTTGLVPCGCGGKAGFHYSVMMRDNDCYVECGVCGGHTRVVLGEDEARDIWNTAMGWRVEE